MVDDDAAGWCSAPDCQRVYVRQLKLRASIGIHPHEKRHRQPVLISLDLWQAPPPANSRLHYKDVICYEQLTKQVEQLVAGQHVELVETLAEQLAQLCLNDSRVQRVRVRVEKTRALRKAAGAGVDIMRKRQPSSGGQQA